MLKAALDLSDVKRKVVSFVKNKVEESQTDGVVLGISGGIDSAVTAYLCVEALGSRRVMGLIMPDLRVTPEGLAPTSCAMVPEAAADGARADESKRPGGHDAAEPGESEEHFGGDRVFLRPRRAVAGGRSDESAVDAHARAAAFGLGPRRLEPQAGRLRGARRPQFALRPNFARSKPPKARTSA